MTNEKKPIVVTMGEPSGISSEIIIKTWKKRKIFKIPPFVLIDDLQKLKIINEKFNYNVNFQSIKNIEKANEIFYKSIPVIDLNRKIKSVLGTPDINNSKVVIESINRAFELVLNNKASSILTLPVCKRTLKKSKFNYKGQTEYLSFLTKKKTGLNQSEIMILSTTKPVDKGSNLIVGLITTHIPMSKINTYIKKNIIFEKILSFKNALSKIWKIQSPKIAIASVNPHAGEGGLIGNEEVNIIQPVLKKCKDLKIDIAGPLSSDSCFHKESRENFDGILCFYHDQGLIPIKTLDFKNSINVTGGLPFIRVSPDHGPAFDIAKKNCASINSTVASFNFLKKNIY